MCKDHSLQKHIPICSELNEILEWNLIVCFYLFKNTLVTDDIVSDEDLNTVLDGCLESS